MAELKYQLMLNKEMSWVPCYLKSEADKVIAELKDKIQYWTDLAIQRQRMYEKCRCSLSKTRSKLKRNKIVSELMEEGMPESTAYHRAKIMERTNDG